MYFIYLYKWRNKCMRLESKHQLWKIIWGHRVLLGCLMQRADALQNLSWCCFSHSPGVIEHHSGEVFTGLWQISHRQAERGEQATLKEKSTTLLCDRGSKRMKNFFITLTTAVKRASTACVFFFFISLIQISLTFRFSGKHTNNRCIVNWVTATVSPYVSPSAWQLP